VPEKVDEYRKCGANRSIQKVLRERLRTVSINGSDVLMSGSIIGVRVGMSAVVVFRADIIYYIICRGENCSLEKQ
jgi:hypothetical protein